MSKSYIFIIDTDSYAGNFERDMTAYITGIVGDCGVGKDFSELYKEETNSPELFEDLLEYRSDEGYNRPCAIQSTPGWFANGCGDNFQEKQKGVLVEALRVRNLSIQNNYQKQMEWLDYIVRELKAGHPYSNWTLKTVQTERQRLTSQLTKDLRAKLQKFPAYNSVGIFFFKKPSKDIIQLMKLRATNFTDAKKKLDTMKGYSSFGDIRVIGFRLIEETTTNKIQNIEV